MMPRISDIRARLSLVIKNKTEQGHVTSSLDDRLSSLPASYDALWAFAEELSALPMRTDFPYVEPSTYEEVLKELDPERPRGQFRAIGGTDAKERVRTAFLGSVCGCILGKPLEVNPSMAELEPAFSAIGEWPIAQYVSEKLNLRGNHSFHPSSTETCRERLAYAAADDDINYTLLGMLILEKHGVQFSHDHMRTFWLNNIPPYWAWGPERNFVVAAAARTMLSDPALPVEEFYANISDVLNPGEELCGAMIRADAYGYACPGNPELAVELAHRDASLTHRKNGIYGSMFAAAAIAVAPVAKNPLEIFELALRFIPRRSRFFKIVSDSLSEVQKASDYWDGYRRIHGKYAEYSHCRVFQESGTLINTLRFADDIGDGICKQVMQGNDTDSYGATVGSILGLYFGPEKLKERWLSPFNDRIHTSLAEFHETSLSAVAERMSCLPELLGKSSQV